VVEAELRDGTAAQPDHQHVLRLGDEQQERHHLARVGAQQLVGIAGAHRALHGIRREEQHAAVLTLEMNGCPSEPLRSRSKCSRVKPPAGARSRMWPGSTLNGLGISTQTAGACAFDLSSLLMQSRRTAP